MRFLTSRWTPEAKDDHEFAVRWLLCEATVVATLNAVGIAGFAVRRGGEGFDEYVDARLAEGSIPTHQMRAIARSFDNYLSGVLTELGASKPAIVQSLGAFEPKPPDYSAAVAELARRLAAGAIHARHLPRWADLMVFERVLREQEPSAALVGRLGIGDSSKVAHAGRLVAAFLKTQGLLPLPIVAALGNDVEPGADENAAVAPNATQEEDQLSLPGS
jgi:hypothetical protein